MQRLLICIDDTDNLESIGTGQLLENLCRAMQEQGLGTPGFVSRHQLFIDDRIAYTSHNSSMCCAFDAGDLAAVSAFAVSYLREHAAAGSDPGLCILPVQDSFDYSPLTDFGLRAQREVLEKAEAYALAEKIPGLSLSEHGGTGDGVIGALAGVGLRLSGSDGKIKGKILPTQVGERLTIAQFKRQYSVDQVLSDLRQPLPDDTELLFEEPTKAVLICHRKTVLAEFRDGVWHPMPHRGRKQQHVEKK